MTLCECGCGKELPKRKDGKTPHFWHGHGKSSKIDTTCAKCGKKIKVHQWRLETFALVFCSKKCLGQHRINLETHHCTICGKPITRKPFRFTERCFCSQDCLSQDQHNRNKKVIVQCSYCGASLQVFPSKAKANKHFYCNRACRASHITGKNNPSYTDGKGRKREYSRDWKQQRRKALERDSFKCQLCGKSPKKARYLHVHHITPAYKFQDTEIANQLINLITLCHTCHKKVESGKASIQAKLL